MAEVLVTVETPYGSAGVVRDEQGFFWLSDRTDHVSGTRLDDYRPVHAGLDDQTLIGGRLPSGAVGAEVIDDAGERIAAAAENGAWVALLDQPITGEVAPVWCFDASREPVAPPLPAEWPRRRVADVVDPCPACGRTVWDEVTATDESRGMCSTGAVPLSDEPPPFVDYTGYEPTPFVVCCACGHEESIGGVVHFASGQAIDPAEIERGAQEAEARWRQGQAKTLESVRFPIFADQLSPAKLCGSGGRNGRTTEITVAHERLGSGLRVRTEHNERQYRSDYSTARSELEYWVSHEPGDLPTSRSDAGLTMAQRARDRARRRRAATATREEVQIRVDGSPEAFCLLRSGNQWVAVRTRASETLTIFAEDVDPSSLDLTPVRDPLGELL